MIDPQEIVRKAERVYARAVSAWLAGDETFFPYRMPCDLSLPDSQSDLIRQVDLLRGESKEVRGFGYSIAWEVIAKRKYGENPYPVAITIDSLQDLVKLTRKVMEFRSLCLCVERVRDRFPKLDGWVAKNWPKLLAVESQLNELLAVVQFMIDNPRPDCFTRELPLSISSKLIERNKPLLSSWFDSLLPDSSIDYGVTRSFEQRYGFRYVQQHLLIRFLDDELAREVNCPWKELSLPASEIADLPIDAARVFIVENKLNLLTLPKMPRGIALGGRGDGVTALFDVPWLATQPIYYWGDLDVDGFEILASLRHRFPQTRSLLMDLETLEKYRSLATSFESRPRDEPPELTESELAAFRVCMSENLRLEQEHIPQAEVNRWFQEFESGV